MLEEVVGEIDVGYDFDEYLPRRRRVYEMLDEEVYLMDSRLPISEVNDALEINLPLNESHTIGGLVMNRLRRIPVRGESIVEAGYRFTVEGGIRAHRPEASGRAGRRGRTCAGGQRRGKILTPRDRSDRRRIDSPSGHGMTDCCRIISR